MSSIVGSNNMGTPFFHELKKQASFFLREKIKTARLALTDVTPAELLTEEATNGNPWAPDTRTMGLISRAAFEIDDYWRIVEILHKRLARYDIKHWRESYQALVLLEHLITHGPESVAAEFRSDRDVIRELESFQYIDERGFNWGLTVRKKSERILQLLEKGPLLKEERDRARKLTRGIEGFGSFCQRSSFSADKEQPFNTYGRCNSHYSGYSREEDLLSSLKEGGSIKQDKSNEQNKEIFSSFDQDKEMENSNPSGSFNRVQIFKNEEILRQPLKENKAHRSLQNSRKVSTIPMKKHLPEEFNKQIQGQAPNPLLDSQKNNPKNESAVEEDHPFSTYENQTTASLLSPS